VVAPVSIAAMAVWIVTVIIGAYLLASGISNEHRQAPADGAPGAAGGHPLLEFCHPALGLIGLMLWIFFVVTDHPAFAWIAFGTLAVTALAGTTWLISGLEGRRRARAPGGPVFPRHLVLLHGFAVTCTFVLVLIASLTVGHS
jgi:manganese efflux pump family protein